MKDEKVFSPRTVLREVINVAKTSGKSAMALSSAPRGESMRSSMAGKMAKARMIGSFGYFSMRLRDIRAPVEWPARINLVFSGYRVLMCSYVAN